MCMFIILFYFLEITHLYAGDPIITFHTKTPFLTLDGTGSFLCCISYIIWGVRVSIVIPMNFRFGPSANDLDVPFAFERNSFT